MKRAREKDELLRFIWANSGPSSFWKQHPRTGFHQRWLGSQDWIGASTREGVQNNTNAYLMRLIRCKQDDSERKEEGSAKVKTGEEERGVVLQSYNWFSECTMEVFSKSSAIMQGERALIREWYQKHKNGRRFMRGVDCSGWCRQIETRCDSRLRRRAIESSINPA